MELVGFHISNALVESHEVMLFYEMFIPKRTRKITIFWKSVKRDDNVDRKG